MKALRLPEKAGEVVKYFPDGKSVLFFLPIGANFASVIPAKAGIRFVCREFFSRRLPMSGFPPARE